MIEINNNIDYNTLLGELDTNISSVLDISNESSIENKHYKTLKSILNNNDLKLLSYNILKKKYEKDFQYKDLLFIYETLDKSFNDISKLKEKVDISIFFKKGKIINIPKLRKKFYLLGRHKLFPNFNFKKLKELFEDPPIQLKPLDGSSDEFIVYDRFVVRKYLYGILQMVVNEMDLLVGFTGIEGSAKSTACSQDINLIYYLLKELELIEYDYDIKNLWFNTLEGFIEAEDRYYDEKFRIIGLDEGNELNRQEWQNDLVRTFFQRLRRERYNQRIKLICIPQLGELLTSIVLSRMNFNFNLYTRDDIETGTIDKGFCNFYIIPRSNKIYSPYQKREINKEEIIDTLGNVLQDRKKHLKELPRTLLIKRFRRNHIWGFDVNKYRKHLKDSNKTFSVSKGVRLSEYACYWIFKASPQLKEWNIDRENEKAGYSTLQKTLNKINKMFLEDPSKLEKYENLIKKKHNK